MNRRIFILGILILLVATPGFAWLSGWGARQPFNVTSPGNLTDYQIRVNVSYDSDMDTDFDDIRFTDTSDNLLNIWLEEKVDSAYAIFWVKGNWKNTNNTQGYIYYDRSGQSSASDGWATAWAFDDFSVATLNSTMWDESDADCSSVSTVDGVLNVTSSGGQCDVILKTAIAEPVDFRLLVDLNLYTTDYIYVNYRFDSDADRWFLNGREPDNEWRLYSGGGGLIDTAAETITKNVWYDMDFKIHDSNHTIFKNDASLISISNGDSADAGDIKLSLIANTAKFDTFALFKYILPDPTYEFGTEETSAAIEFTWDPYYPHTNETVQFNATWDSGNFTKFWWNFTDSNTSYYTTNQLVNFSGFLTSGSVVVNVTGYDATGVSNHTSTDTLTIYDNVSKVVISVSEYLPFLFKNSTIALSYTSTGGIPIVNSSWVITQPNSTTHNYTNQSSFHYSAVAINTHTVTATVCDLGNDLCISNSTQFKPWNVTSTSHWHTPYNITTDSMAELFYGDSVTFVSDGTLNWGLSGETKVGTTTTWTPNTSAGFWNDCNYIHYNFTVNNSWGTHVSNQSFTAVTALYNISVGCIDYRTPYCFILAEIFDIATGTQISEATNTYDYFLTTIDGYGHTNETTSNYTGANLNLSLCMNTTPIITALTLDGIIGYGAVNYTDSSYAFDIASMDFVTSCTYANGHRYKFYTVSNTTTTYDTTFIIKQGGGALPDALVKIQAPVDDNWVVIMSGVTSANGKVTFPLEQCYTYYKIIVEQAGETLHESNVTCLMATECSASAGTCERIIDVDITVQEWYSVQAGIGSSCEYDSTNSYLKCTVSDTSGKGLSSELNVYMLTSNTPLCTETETSTTTTLICSTVGWLSGPYKFNLKVTTADNTYVINSGGFTIGSETTLGTEGPIVALAVLITLIFAVAKTNPVVLTVTATLGFVLLGVLKLTAISYTVTGWIVAMGLVAIIRGLSK